jgi:ABC-type amino acid transport substrate-binding protein
MSRAVPPARRIWLAAAGVLALGLLAALLVWQGGSAVPGLFRRDATWVQMQASKDFRVGLDPSFPPFEDLTDAGEPVGYDVDLARALAAHWGLVAKLDTIGYDSLIDALKAARVDAVISAMPYDERLTRDVTYSTPYFEAGIRLAVRPGIGITGTADLAGRQVAVEWGSAGDAIARRLVREGIALESVPFDTPQAALEAAATGRADAVLVDNVSLRLAQGQGMDLVAVGPVLEPNPYVIVTPRRATTLAAEVAAALEVFAQDGTLAAIEARWFGLGLAPPAPAPSMPAPQGDAP